MAAETFEPYHQQEGGAPKRMSSMDGSIEPPQKKRKTGGKFSFEECAESCDTGRDLRVLSQDQ